MIKDHAPQSDTTWQSGYLAMLPEIEPRLRNYFRDLNPEARDDSTEDGIVHSMLAYARLFERGRSKAVTPSNLAWFGMLQVRKGRQACCRMNSKEPLSRYAQLANGISVMRLHDGNLSDDTWINDIVDDRRSSIPDQVATRLDTSAWLASLCRRTRNIATDLAKGFSTSEVARKYCLSAGRIAQMRRELHQSWSRFQGDTSLVAAD